MFDLTEVDWSATMTEAQLEDAAGRLKSGIGMDGRPTEVRKDDTEMFDRFVAEELKLRSARPPVEGRTPPPPTTP